MADLFGRDPVNALNPVTSDQCTLLLDGANLAEAIQVSISYNQSVTRRRAIGGKSAVIYGSQPTGQATIARMLATNGSNIFNSAMWTGCGKGTVTFTPKGCGGTGNFGAYNITGAIVSSYSIQAQAEDLTVVDNITIDFLQLTKA